MCLCALSRPANPALSTDCSRCDDCREGGGKRSVVRVEYGGRLDLASGGGVTRGGAREHACMDLFILYRTISFDVVIAALRATHCFLEGLAGGVLRGDIDEWTCIVSIAKLICN